MARSLFPTRRPSPTPAPPPQTPAPPQVTAWDEEGYPLTIPDSVVDWGWYLDGVRQDTTTSLPEATKRALDHDGFVWLGLKEPDDDDMAGLARMFNLHPLAIEDAVEGHTRSKLEQFGSTLFLVISTVAYVPKTDRPETSEVVATGQLMVFVGEHFVMTVRRGDHNSLKGLRAALDRDPESLSHGPVSVLYHVLDLIVDSYQQVVEEFEEDIDELEELVFSPAGARDTESAYQLKRELIEFKRAVTPLGSPLTSLATRPYAVVPSRAQAYFREVSDHHTETREAIQAYDEVLSTILAASQNRIAIAENDDMRKISAFVAIAAIPTLIAGIFGMNFTHMPELEARYGYYIVLGVMVTLMVALFGFFRHRRWL